MIRQIYIMFFCVLTTCLLGQRDSMAMSHGRICYENGAYKTLDGIGEVRIYLKDGTSKVRCSLKEIKTISIVYLKDRVLHDLMIDKIKYIRIEDTGEWILFDEKNRPYIKR